MSALEALHQKLAAIFSQKAEDTNTDQGALLKEVQHAAEGPSSTAVDRVLARVTQVLHYSCTAGVACASLLLDSLADLTRTSEEFRAWFGLPVKQKTTLLSQTDPDCVLHIALKVLNDEYVNLRSITGNSKVACLRIVANCCADNDHNRMVVLLKDGLNPLLDLAIAKHEVEILVPALYNVCSDDSEIRPSDVQATAAEFGQVESAKMYHRETFDLISGHDNLSLMGLELAFSLPDSAKYTVFELLLSLSEHCSPDRREYLASLVQMATQPAENDLKLLFHGHNARTRDWSWSYELEGKRNTLEVAKLIADENVVCRIHILQAMMSILSQELAREALFTAIFQNLRNLIDLTNAKASRDSDEDDDELRTCNAAFIKTLTLITEAPKFTDLNRLADCRMLAAASIDRLLDTISPVEVARACEFTMLAQVAAIKPMREELMDNLALLSILPSTFLGEQSHSILYPAMVLVSRLALVQRVNSPLLSSTLLKSIREVFHKQGMGFSIPFEAVNTYRSLFRGRPQAMSLYWDIRSDDSVITDLFRLFHRTIEAGTKLEVGLTLVEIMRTMSPLTNTNKDPEASIDPVYEQYRTCFTDFLQRSSGTIAQALVWVSCRAEPQNQRVHGWFGLGLLAVWHNGRQPILQAIRGDDGDDFVGSVLETSQIADGPGPNNIRLFLAALMPLRDGEVDESHQKDLETAARNLRLGSAIFEGKSMND